MAAKNNDININTVLLIGGAVLLWPVISGLLSLSNFAGGILSAPGKFADAMNREIDEAIKDGVYSQLLKIAKTTVYDTSNPAHKKLMDELRKTNDIRAAQIIAEWKREGKGFDRLFAAMTLNAAMKKINDFLKKWW